MNDLSIIIKADEEDIIKYIEILEPILKKYEYELILVNNHISKINIPYKYSVYKFSEEYRKFKKFCFASSLGKKILIIEKNMDITKELMDAVTINLEEEENINLSYNMKSYLSEDLSLFFVREKVMVYNRGVKGFNRNIGITLEDFSFIDGCKEDIDECIYRFISKKYYNELYSWYENYVLKMPEEFQSHFYLTLENAKFHMDEYYISKIDNLFCNSKYKNKYIDYLKLRKLYRENYNKNYGEIIKKIENIGITNEDVYYCWLLREFAINKNNALSIFGVLDANIQKTLMQYLFNKDINFIELIYNLIIDADENHEIRLSSKHELGTYINILKNYIEYMKYKCDSPIERKRVLRVFDLYINYSTIFFDINAKENIINEYKDEIKFISELCIVKDLIEKNSIEQAIDKLAGIGKQYKDEFEIIQYYIQRLRWEKNCYSYILSICIIVKDEEKNLERCLFSLKPLVDSKLGEIIIVDTGSVDGTVEIAKKYTNKISYHPWAGNFSEARNFSISFAEGRYIFVMDADEEFKPSELARLIKEFSNNEYMPFNTFTFKLINYTDKELTQFVMLTQPRIFINNGSFYYSSAVHNQPVFNLPVKNLDIEIVHYGYIMTEDIKEKKFQRTATMLKRELEKNPNNIYYRYQLSTSYAMYGDFKEALKQVEIYMRMINEEGTIDDIVVMYFNNAASIYISCYKYDEALEVSDRALSIQPDFIDFIYYKAYILSYRRKYDEAILYIGKYLNIVDNYYELDIASDGRYSFNTLSYKDDVIRLFVLSSHRLKKYEECLTKVNLIMEDRIFKNCLYQLVDSCFKTGNYMELAKHYKSRIKYSSNEDMGTVFKYFLGECILNSSDIDKKRCLEAFHNENIDKKFIKYLKLISEKEKVNNVNEKLLLIAKYDIDGMDFESFWNIFKSIMPMLEAYDINRSYTPLELKDMKLLAQLILHRTEEIIIFKTLTVEELICIFQKYMNLCSRLIKAGSIDLLEARERLFISKVLNAFDELKAVNYRETIKDLKESIIYYNEMDNIIELALQILIPGYCDGIEYKENKIKAVKKDNASSYENVLSFKMKIEEAAGYGQTDKILELYKEYDESKIDDPELYYFKALALMSEEMLYEAGVCIKNGLIRYPDDFHLLNNLCSLQLLKQDYKSSEEILCRIGMLYPEADITDLCNIVFQLSEKPNKTNIKVLQGTMDLSYNTINLTEALRSKGINAKVLNYVSKHTNYKEDYVFNVNSFNSGKILLSRTIDAATRLIPEFDVFHFHYGTTLNFNHTDLRILKELNKKVFMHFWGQDVRMYSKAVTLNPYIEIGNKSEDEIKSKLDMMSKYISCCIIGDYELNEYVKDYFTDTKVINPMIDLNSFKPVYKDIKNDVLTIVHAPTSKEMKGTKYIINAIDDLKDKYNIDFKIVQGIPHEEAIEIYQEADLIIDQLLIGSYGLLSIEAMALGKPVICWISDFMCDKYPKELPIIIANPENIKEKLEYAIRNKDMLKEIGTKGRLYVEKYHNINKEVDKIIDLYYSYIN